MSVIIIPRERDCILVEGRKYCESNDISATKIIGIFLIALLVMGAILLFAKLYLDWRDRRN